LHLGQLKPGQTKGPSPAYQCTGHHAKNTEEAQQWHLFKTGLAIQPADAADDQLFFEIFVEAE